MQTAHYFVTLLLAVGTQNVFAATVIDFDSMPAGTVINTQYAGVSITSSHAAHLPMIFNSSNPTGGDVDLGTPHRDFGGPGLGGGGSVGQTGENNTPLGNVLIISEDNESSDPDDNANGGTLYFRFDTAVVLSSIGILDFDTDETGGKIGLFDALIGGTELGLFSISNLGNNSFQRLDLLGTTGVRRVEVTFPSSGAITDLQYSVPLPSTLALLPIGLLALTLKKTIKN